MTQHTKGTPAFFDMVLDAKNLEEDAMRLFAEIRPAWKKDDLDIKVGEKIQFITNLNDDLHLWCQQAITWAKVDSDLCHDVPFWVNNTFQWNLNQ